jgi:hypothetical protein
VRNSAVDTLAGHQGSNPQAWWQEMRGRILESEDYEWHYLEVKQEEGGKRVMQEIEALTQSEIINRDALKAKKELELLEAQHRSAMLHVEELSRKLNEARLQADRTAWIAQRSGATKDPPLPSWDELYAAAKAQCPERDPRELHLLVGRLHASISSGASRAGMNAGVGDLPPMEGDEVRDTADHEYNLPAPTGPGGPVTPGGPLTPFIKSYG